MERKKSRIVNYRLSIKNYPLYKDSAIDWIGEIPKHWEITAVTSITTPVSIKNHPNEELLSVYRDHGVIIKKTREDNHNRAGENLASYKLVEPNYLVINKMKAWQGSLGISEFRGIVSPAYITCKTDEKIIARGYLHHLLRCRSYINEYNRLSYGVRNDQWDMRYDDFKYVPVLLPPLSEQKDIAHYLDTKIAQIDRKIDLLTQIAQRYEELKRAIVNETVTRGLDKSVPMKDSAIEWIGEIPEHWEIHRIKDFTYVKGRIGWQGLRSSDFLDTGDYYCVTGTDLVDGLINWSDCYFVSKSRYEQDKYIQLKVGDLLITKDGTIGKTALVDALPKEATLNSGLFVTRPLKDKYLNVFLYWVLHSSVFRNYIDLTKGGSTIQHLYQNVFDRFLYCCPPLTEQKEISDYLSRKSSHIDQIIQNINLQIEKQQELRKTLINDVVTGKIKVIDN